MADSSQSAASTPERLEIAQKLQEIFMPYAVRTRAAMVQRKGRFVHQCQKGG
jgi:hypothetical protein